MYISRGIVYVKKVAWGGDFQGLVCLGTSISAFTWGFAWGGVVWGFEDEVFRGARS